MKWDVKLFIVSILVYVIYIVFNYVDSGAVVPPLFLNVFYLPVFAAAMAVSSPFTFGSVICLFLALGHLAWPMEVYAISASEYLLYGSMIGLLLAAVGFAVVAYNNKYWKGLTRILIASLSLMVTIQLLNVFFWKSDTLVLLTDFFILGAGYLLILPRITDKIPRGQQRVILVLLLEVSYNHLSQITT